MCFSFRICIERLGAEKFAQAYVYVYGRRVKDSDQDMDEFQFQTGLRKFCSDPNTGFLLDQLVFLEHGIG
ncbi:hypothetical protein Ciccas_001729 [Cichlidogyrus casuarinus]|uniref:Uncharacterized protein n=1 Tax=Cichlidogyrus casuarinus TaxID=1844966 RepID=A0ABD2QKA6_9PLAT